MADLLMLLCLCWVAFVFSPSCNCCDIGTERCAQCSGTTEDRNMQIAISGMSGNNCANADCEQVHGTYTLPPKTATQCEWFVKVTADVSGCNSCTNLCLESLFFQVDQLPTVVLLLRYEIPPIDPLTTPKGQNLLFDKVFADPVDCSTFLNEDIPIRSGTASACNNAATCELTSL